MKSHHWILAPALLLALTVTAAAQPDSDDAAADSLVAGTDQLFGDSVLHAQRPQLPRDESRPLATLRPGDFSPQFAVPFHRRDLLGLEDISPLLLSYDRADGLYIGLGSTSSPRLFRERRIAGHLGFGYAFGAHYWQVLGGLALDVGERSAPLRLGAEGHIITDTKDAWKMSVDENTAAALLAGVDARDYYQRSGFSVDVTKFFTRRIGLGAEYRIDTYHNSKREIGWSLFGPHQPFFEVPPVREGSMSSVVVHLMIDEMAFRSWDDPQIGFEAHAEFGKLGESFQQYVADLRAKMTLIDERLFVAVHLRLGSATGAAPPQKLFSVGGIGTIPGFQQNEFTGNRMLLIATDLLFAPMPKLGLRIIVSNDAASIATEAPESGLFAGLLNDISEMKYSPGIYLGSATGTFRIGYAFRTDIFRDPRFVLRLSQPF